MDKERFCRICLKSVHESVCLFSDSEASREILNKIYFCTQLLLEPEIDLPSDICSSCLEELYIAFSFRSKCLTINERFKTYCEQSDIYNKQDDISLNLFSEDSQCGTEQDLISQKTVLQEDITGNKINKETSFQCDICTKALKSLTSLLRHKVLMHEKRKHVGKVTGFGSNRRFHCTSCSYSTPHSQTLTNHMRRHEGDRPYICECGKSFTQTSSLTAHRKTHSSTTYFTCTMCGKQFKFAYALKAHQSVHEDGRYPCQICHKVLKQRRTLEAHLKRHYKICNYSCEECGSTFVTIAELINHKKRHDLNKNIECHICGYKTNMKKNLIQHLKRHGGEKPYKCNICDTSCFTSTALKLHQRRHTHEKPFSCPACTQRFRHSSSLNKHMQTLHGVAYKWSDVKSKGKAILKMFTTKDY